MRVSCWMSSSTASRLGEGLGLACAFADGLAGLHAERIFRSRRWCVTDLLLVRQTQREERLGHRANLDRFRKRKEQGTRTPVVREKACVVDDYVSCLSPVSSSLAFSSQSTALRLLPMLFARRKPDDIPRMGDLVGTTPCCSHRARQAVLHQTTIAIRVRRPPRQPLVSKRTAAHGACQQTRITVCTCAGQGRETLAMDTCLRGWWHVGASARMTVSEWTPQKAREQTNARQPRTRGRL